MSLPFLAQYWLFAHDGGTVVLWSNDDLNYVVLRSDAPFDPGSAIDLRGGGFRVAGSMWGSDTYIHTYVRAIDRRYFRGRYYGDWATSQHHYTMRYPGTLTLSQITETEWIEPVARAGSTETGGGAIVVACVAIGDSALNIDPVDL